MLYYPEAVNLALQRLEDIIKAAEETKKNGFGTLKFNSVDVGIASELSLLVIDELCIRHPDLCTALWWFKYTGPDYWTIVSGLTYNEAEDRYISDTTEGELERVNAWSDNWLTDYVKVYHNKSTIGLAVYDNLNDEIAQSGSYVSGDALAVNLPWGNYVKAISFLVGSGTFEINKIEFHGRQALPL